MSGSVDVEESGRVLWLRLNRPKKANALTPEMAVALSAALDRLERDERLRVGIVRGVGDRAFCAGADLDAIASGNMAAKTGHLRWGFGGLVRRPVRKPLIALVNGAAVAGGMEILLACTLALAVPDASFGLPEINRGLFAGAGGGVRLPRISNPKLAAEMLLLAETLDADQALEAGLINRIVDPLALDDEGQRLAERLAVLPVPAVEATMDLLNAAGDPEHVAWAINDKLLPTLVGSDVVKEGVRSFKAGQAPSWHVPVVTRPEGQQ